MSVYRIDENTVVNTKKAIQSWTEASDWNGSNHIGRSSCSQWHDETLYKTRKGRYYVEHCSRVQGQTDSAEWLSPQAAVRWLLHNEIDLPADLEQYRDQVEE